MMQAFLVEEVLKFLLPEPFEDFQTEGQDNFAEKCLTDFFPEFLVFQKGGLRELKTEF